MWRTELKEQSGVEAVLIGGGRHLYAHDRTPLYPGSLVELAGVRPPELGRYLGFPDVRVAVQQKTRHALTSRRVIEPLQ
ncbi:hypothetical protein BLAT2472_130009 [Burkholderia latens]